MTTTPIDLQRPEGKGLATGTLGLWGSTVIGLASTAPVYSLVATLGFVVLAVGAQAPIAFVIAFIPMLFIAFAYRELNNEIPDCGTTFTWGTKAFGPWVGWLGGWGVAVAGIYCAIVTFVILMIVKFTIGLRVTREEEMEGLDLTQHGESIH